KVEPVDGAEAIAQRTAEQSLAGGSSDTGEVRQRQRGGARPDSLTKHGVETEILQRRIERFLDDGVQAVDLVDEEDVAGGEVQKNRSQRALVVDGRAGAHLDGDAELVGDDVGERGLAKAGRPAQQDMLHGLAPAASAAARGIISSSATASSRGLSSMITFAAVRAPTPLARRMGAVSSLTIARFSTSRLAALRMLSPTLGPTPSTWISISNRSSSS